MKRLLLALLLATSLNADIAQDKYKHAAAGLVIYGVCLVGSDVLGWEYWDSTTCLIPVAVAGVGKELYDSQSDNHTAEFADMFATMVIPMSLSVVVYRW